VEKRDEPKKGLILDEEKGGRRMMIEKTSVVVIPVQLKKSNERKGGRNSWGRRLKSKNSGKRNFKNLRGERGLAASLKGVVESNQETRKKDEV